MVSLHSNRKVIHTVLSTMIKSSSGRKEFVQLTRYISSQREVSAGIWRLTNLLPSYLSYITQNYLPMGNTFHSGLDTPHQSLNKKTSHRPAYQGQSDRDIFLLLLLFLVLFFETRFSVALELVLELALVDHTGLRLRDQPASAS